MIESGYERVGFARRDSVRWWLWLELDGGRPQAPRRGVVDRGFHFARGGTCVDEQEAQDLIRFAYLEAQHEWRGWTHQPTHALGPAGELIPLDVATAEIEA